MRLWLISICIWGTAVDHPRNLAKPDIFSDRSVKLLTEVVKLSYARQLLCSWFVVAKDNLPGWACNLNYCSFFVNQIGRVIA